MNRYLWCVLEGLLALGAIAGGLSMIKDPTGADLGLPPAATMLQATPFHDYWWPAIILIVANGLLPLGAIVLNLARFPSAAIANLLVGLVLTGWMIGQLWLLGYQFFLQAVLLGYGALLLTLAMIALRPRLLGSAREPHER